MSRSPSTSAMGIGSVLNNQSGLLIMATEQQHHPGQAQMHPQYALERPNSPHGSEHSRYSGPMNTSYPSPTAMGAQLPPVPNANMGPAPHGLAGLPPSAPHGMVPTGMTSTGLPPTATQPPPPKAYPCSTCGKGFARRSDLARHGTYASVQGVLVLLG